MSQLRSGQLYDRNGPWGGGGGVLISSWMGMCYKDFAILTFSILTLSDFAILHYTIKKKKKKHTQTHKHPTLNKLDVF